MIPANVNNYTIPVEAIGFSLFKVFCRNAGRSLFRLFFNHLQ